jgi:plastocyanin
VFNLVLVTCFAGTGYVTAAEMVDVTGTVSIVQEGRAPTGHVDNSNAVIWLKRAKGSAVEVPLPKPGKFEMRQQHKRFTPHLLAVPAGSRIAFPNLDPFFHNVFSMFDGKRFDLGLYEAGASHSVTFDRVGVSYIFCNVHPEMSGVVVALDTPWYAVTNGAGEFAIAGVPAGQYLLDVWHERGMAGTGNEFPRTVTVDAANAKIAPIRLRDTGQLLIPHKNKYGADYEPSESGKPVYR